MKSSVLLILAVVILVVGGVPTIDVNTRNVIEDGARIAPGSAAIKGSFPWSVGLYIKTGTGPGFCGGTLIGLYYVLTSAHCTHKAIEIEVVLGAHNITTIEKEQIRMVTREFFPYTYWDPETLQNDIALIKLPHSVHYTTYIKPATLWSQKNNWINDPVNITGWGKTSLQSELSDVLRRTVARIDEDKYCYNAYGDFYNSSLHFCVTGGAICEGDEGGPLNYVGSSGSEYVVGVASYSTPEACNGHPNIPSVYTQIYLYHEWIKQFTSLQYS